MKPKPEPLAGSGTLWERLTAAARIAASSLPDLPSHSSLAERDRAGLIEELGYTFWNQELLECLVGVLQQTGVPRWLEIAAGNGRLTAELARRDVVIAATDDHSQAAERVRSFQRPIRYGSWVEPLEAAEAVKLLRPEGVLCAWPPLGSGLVWDLLSGIRPGAERLRALVCVGEPGGASEIPIELHETPEGWQITEVDRCVPFLVGFNDPLPPSGGRPASRVLVYERLAPTTGGGTSR